MEFNWIALSDQIPDTDIEILAFNPNRGTRRLSAVFKFSSTFSEDIILRTLTDDNYTHWVEVS